MKIRSTDGEGPGLEDERARGPEGPEGPGVGGTIMEQWSNGE